MKLVITLNQNELRLEIRQKGRVIDPAPFEQRPRSGLTSKSLLKRCGVDSETASYYYDLSEVLITTLDKLLKRNSIDATALNLFKIRGNTGKNSTSYRIAAAFVEGLRVRA